MFCKQEQSKDNYRKVRITTFTLTFTIKEQKHITIEKAWKTSHENVPSCFYTESSVDYPFFLSQVEELLRKISLGVCVPFHMPQFNRH